MSLKIIADACRIVDRGQDPKLRRSNRPYSAEEDELVEARSSRPERADDRRYSKTMRALTNSLSKIKGLMSTFMPDYDYEGYEVRYYDSYGDMISPVINSHIMNDKLPRIAEDLAKASGSDLSLEFCTYDTNIDENVISRLGFEAELTEECYTIYYHFNLDTDLNSPEVEKSFRNLGRYLDANDNTNDY